MAIKDQNFEMWAGDYKKVTFVMQDIEDLAGSSVKWIMAQSAKSEPLLIKDCTVNKNEFTVEILPTDIITAGTYYHEAVVTDTEANPVTVAIGKVIVNPSLKNEEVPVDG